VVDESYVEFAPDPEAASVLSLTRRRSTGGSAGGSAARPAVAVANLAVLRSPSKFFGLAGARVGVAWSPSPDLREALRVQRGSWPVSALEVIPVAAALADRDWIAATHSALRADAAWLDGQLRRLVGAAAGGRWAAGRQDGGLVEGSATHFRLVRVDDARRAAQALAAVGLGVRPLGGGHGLPGQALRVSAPRADEREECAAMFTAAVDAGAR
jgi:histidinol-phosphate/aromatic aminotransferase/cobyric acid decarboxylase-like protein